MINKLLNCVLVILVLNSGCALFAPGQETGKAVGALKQTYHILYDTEKFESKGEGAQEAKIRVIEAAGPEVVLNEDGSLNIEKSHLTSYNYIEADPSAREAADFGQSIGAAIVEMGKHQTDSINQILSALLPLINPKEPEPEPEPEP